MSIIKRLLDSSRCGFLQDTELDEVIKENPLQQLLVRCNGCRFVCSAQDAKHIIDIIERDPKRQDWIRDVSIYTGKD
jgi:hypothetical protein